ncbi:MAG: enoyl-CoA hydratase-related protein [Acidimicrobiales bacterium]|nr:enoyl-CoA hydratase-related protein [Acidimicrobiales bacterium]
MTDTTDAGLRIERDGGVEVLTLDRPEARNALTFELYDALETAVRETTARCLVITGADPSFCSGDDVKQIMSGASDQSGVLLSREPALTPAADALLHTDVPIIAAVNGPAVGWGMELALMADIRIASEEAKFGELFVLRGLLSDVAGLGRLAQLVGRENASLLLFTGAVIDAMRAEAIGLVSSVVNHHDLMDTSLALAHEIASRPPLAVQALKRGLRRALDPDWTDLGAWVAAQFGELFRTDDHKEGVQAFLEKRPPEFQGR